MSDGLRSIAALGLVSAGVALSSGFEGEGWCQHRRRPELSYIITPEPLTKRQRRRLRGKAKAARSQETPL